MRWDAVMVRELARELDATLEGARARSVLLDREGTAVLLCLRGSTLLFRLDQAGPTVSSSPPQEPPPESLPLPAKIVGVDSIADERILRIHFRRVRGRAEDPVLIVEFGPRRPNAALADRTSGRIQAALRTTRGPRPMAAGLPYTPPEGEPRRGADGGLDEAAWHRLTSPSGDGTPRRALLGSVAWSSSVNAELLLDPDEGHARWRGLALGEGSDPGWLEGDRGAQPYPVPLTGPGSWHPTSTFLEAVEAAAAHEVAGPGAETRPVPESEGATSAEAGRGDETTTYVPGAAIRALEGELNRAERTLSRLGEELAGLPDPAELRSTADLILARVQQIPRGRSEVSMTGFDGVAVTIRLDPTLDPATNARKLYDRAARAERAARDLPARIASAEERVSAATDLLEQARAGTLPPDRTRALLKGAAGDGGGTAGQARSLPYRRFRSSGGLEIRVGRGAKHNDELTFRHSRPMDVWLHARSVGGAHVVLRWESEDRPPARDLEEAAILAALHSRARTSGSVPVDWTRRKWVRKPRGAKAGSVRVERAQTVFVEPDPDVLERLKDGE